METKILIALTLAIISCLQFTTVSSSPRSKDEHGALRLDGNSTRWQLFPLKRLQRQRRRITGGLCKVYSRMQLIRKLNRLGNKAKYGGYNRRYMAMTWKEARHFTNLVSTVSVTPQNTSAIQNLPQRAPAQKISISPSSNCHTTDTGLQRMCSACPTVTFLGSDRIPSYINEVTCGQSLCAWSMGLCKNAVMLQQFLYKTGRCDPLTGYEEVLPYTQSIRVCCECMLIPY